MQYTPSDLKEKLVQSLDREHNVVDMPGVLDVVRLLETYPITKEVLEQTRLGKDVNEMRRKTNNKDLAKRAKNLVRKWKNLVDEGSTAPSTPLVNGDGVAGRRERLLAGATSPVSPALTPKPEVAALKRQTPKPDIGSRLSPALPRCKADAAKPFTPPQAASTPLPGHAGAKGTADTPVTSISKASLLGKRRIKNDDDEAVPAKRTLGLPKPASESALCDKTGRASPVNGLPPSSHTKLPRPSSDISMGANDRHSPESIPQRSNCATPVNNQKGFPKKHNNVSTPQNAHVATTPKTGLKTPKVRTTLELIKDMADSGSIKVNPGNNTIKRIKNNRIDKEEDIIDQSVVPAGAKPRYRRPPGQNSLTQLGQSDLQQTKQQRVEQFLRTSVNPSTSEFSPPEKLNRTESPNEFDGPYDSWPNHSSNDIGLNGSAEPKIPTVKFFIGGERLPGRDSPSPPSPGVQEAGSECEEAVDVEACEPEAEQASRERDNPWACLPPLNLADIDWTGDNYTVNEPCTPTDAHVERVLSDQWSGVNGAFDEQGDWHDWKETYSMPTYNEDLLHILPYVNLDL